MKSYLFAALSVLATAVVGGLGSAQAPSYYAALSKPAWAPPAWLFGPVWTVLYILIAIAAGLVFSQTHSRRPVLVGVFLGQLALNALWSWLFFAWRVPGIALIEICLLGAAILATMILFWRTRRVAGMLLLPYLLWVSFAAILNAALWLAN